jgi:membrane protein implicated in regulation of membrane protease activity
VLETPTSVECQKFKESNGKCKDEVILKGQTFAFVGDEGNGSVKVFIDGEYSRALGNGEGEFGKPNGIAVTTGLISLRC